MQRDATTGLNRYGAVRQPWALFQNAVGVPWSLNILSVSGGTRPRASLIPAQGNALGKRQWIFIEGQRPVSYLHFRILFTLMPQSLSQVIVHIVFSTKDRQEWLDAAISSRMHAYLATVCRDHDCQAYRVGGAVDHVHLAVRLGRTISQADLIETIKTSSSAWIKKQGKAYRSFFWQRGYGAFSVGFSQLDNLIHYIDTQEEHHRTKTFQEEYRELLRKYHVEFDERYVWD